MLNLIFHSTATHDQNLLTKNFQNAIVYLEEAYTAMPKFKLYQFPSEDELCKTFRKHF